MSYSILKSIYGENAVIAMTRTSTDGILVCEHDVLLMNDKKWLHTYWNRSSFNTLGFCTNKHIERQHQLLPSFLLLADLKAFQSDQLSANNSSHHRLLDLVIKMWTMSVIVKCKYSMLIGRSLVMWPSVMVHTFSKYHIDQAIFSNIVLSSWCYYCDAILYYCLIEISLWTTCYMTS